MHEKNIKRMVTKQLKKNFPHWKRLARKQKQALDRQVLEAVVKEYSFEKEVTALIKGVSDFSTIDCIFNYYGTSYISTIPTPVPPPTPFTLAV